MSLTYRLRPVCAALMLLLAPVAAWASANDKIFYPSYGRGKATQSATEKQADEQRRHKISQDAQHIFTLVGAEIAHTRGQELLALNTYIDVFNKTKSPEVAERAIELAISQKAHTAAEQIFNTWQKIQPESSPALRRVAWRRALDLSQYDEMVKQLPVVLAESDEQQTRVIFLRLAQASIVQKALPKATYDAVYQASQNYPKLIEAQITSILFSAAIQQDNRAIEGLMALAKMDDTLSDATRVGLSLIVRDHPTILTRFFEKTNTEKLPLIWQELEVEYLIQNKKMDAAFTKLHQLAERYPEKDFLLRVALLSHEQKNNWQTTLAYFNKAYHHANTQTQKSEVALAVAIRLIDDKQAQKEIDTWLNRIQASEFAFDRYVLQMGQFAVARKWQDILTIDKKVKSENLHQGKVFRQDVYQELYLSAVSRSTLSSNKKLSVFNQAMKQARQHLNDPEHKTIYLAALYGRGLLYLEELGQPAKGLADLREYLREKPDSATAMNALGYSLIEYSQHLDEGFELIKQSYQKEPEQAAINDSMGWAYFKKGDSKTALPYLQFAHKHEPDAEVAAHLGEVYWALGNQDKAREVWHEAWQRDKQHKILLRTLKRHKVQFK